MSVLEVIGAIGSVGFGTTAIVLALRNGGLRSEITRADSLREKAENDLKATTAEYDTYRERAEQQLHLLQEELEHFENHELDAIEEEPDRTKRIERRRSWVRSLLSKAPSSPRDDGEAGMREDSPTDETAGDIERDAT